MDVFLILTPIFVLVGVWLFLYSRRRSQLVKRFAVSRGLLYRQEDDGTLEQSLNRAFSLQPPLGRSFYAIRDIVEGSRITLFRATEALDLSHYGMPQNTHFSRIAVLLATEWDEELYFLAKSPQAVTPIFPKDTGQIATDTVFNQLKQLIKDYPPPHLLSVTVMRGHVLLYLEPTLTGSEKETDLNYLFDLAKKIKAV